MTTTAQETEPDPRRWFAAAVVIVSVFIPVLDNTILNLAVPTILRDFGTDLPSLQWVITGYSLTFATLLIIGGRLGDMFGHRRTFIVGAAIFGTGSLLAAFSQSVPQLFVGEALVEGIGASLMLPATLAILSTTFEGQERARAFAAWGAVAGLAVVAGPLVGGLLTTEFSWRWAFGINVIVAPVIVVGAVVFMRDSPRPARRPRLDVPGALLIASGSFTLVYGLSEGAVYGWWSPIKAFRVGGVSPVPWAFLASGVLFGVFYVVEHRKEREGRDPLFEFGQLHYHTFRWGLLTTMTLAMGQFALIFVVPVWLQTGVGLSALETGKWMVPMGLVIALGAPLAGRAARWVSITAIVRTGLVLQVVGLLLVIAVVEPGVTFWELLPGSVVFGLGIGFASSQLVNVILSDVDPEKVGVASGTNTTVRQVGLALGIATFSSFLNTFAIRHGSALIHAAPLPPDVKAPSLVELHAKGVNFTPPPNASRGQAAALERIMQSAAAAGARPALLFAAAVVTVGTGLSFLIPRVTVARAATDPASETLPAPELA